MFNPAKAADEIKKEYIGYISTTFHFRNQKLQEKLVEELDKTVSNGPFVEMKDSFKSGASIKELMDKGVLTPLFSDLERGKPQSYQRKLPLDRPLYFHQQKAIEKIVAGNNVVVSTGTGSGKTNCFMIPVINSLLREKEEGTLCDGVRAIFIYPMNALANDQIKGLREILMHYPDIRFGVYNGGTENKEKDAIKLYEAMYANEKYPELKTRLKNEEVSRDEMKKRPPHILFTNYAMLEHMLFRPGDDSIFSNSNFKFVVLDEAHVYAGAMGIETSFLMGRLKGRINGERRPQFILTSATLGDGSPNSNKKVVDFANRLTGCKFEEGNIITADRDNSTKSETIIRYPIKLFSDLANDELFFEDVLNNYGISVDYSRDKEPEILYDLISSSYFYSKMRKKGHLVKLDDFSDLLEITKSEAVEFVSLCAKARKNGKPLIDIRYHYFLKALDGCYLAPDYPDSLSLVRKDEFPIKFGEYAKMFEVAVCEDCGEVAIVGRIVGNKLVRSNSFEDRHYFQIRFRDEDEADEKEVEYCLCKSCGAIVPSDEAHNNWCTCGNTQIIRLYELENENCLNCGGRLRRFNLGYDAATGVIATALYEQIPEYAYSFEESETQQGQKKNIFLKTNMTKRKNKSKTGSQFLIFSDSRQGAAKFACFLTDSYKEFLRRRGIWNVVSENELKYPDGVSVGEFVQLLENYFSTLRLFRHSNSDNAESSVVDNRRNAWVAILNELYNCNRDTSLVSLGKISFEYLGNDDDIIDALVENYGISKVNAKNYLNYLAFEVVRSGAIITDNLTDINDTDREYLFFTPNQKVITKHKESDLYGSQGFMPTPYTLKTGEQKYYHSNKLEVTKKALSMNDKDAVDFLNDYWDYLVSSDNKYKLHQMKGKGYTVQASSFRVKFGRNALLWKCNKCGKVTQFNIGNDCIQMGCNGKLERLDSDEFCRGNYYAMLYGSSKVAPLFVKEHTAQLEKKDALDYQQQFVRKEINALSCSTTFEMGVDVGDLETVFLRNIPPLPSNYAQRVGRAGRSIDAAAFALTFARLSSHDFTFFDRPKDMINGIITPPSFILDNEKILRRHVYAIALSLYLKKNPNLYDGNNAKAFINDKGYCGFIEWLKSEPVELTKLLKDSITGIGPDLRNKYVDSFGWLKGFCGEGGAFTNYIENYESNIDYLKKEYEKAMRSRDDETARVFKRKLDRYERNDLIDFLVRGNVLPKYGFPIDSVELNQNISSDRLKSLNLNRDLSVAIAEYAPSSEIVADGGLYTSRYIRKPVVNKNELSDFETGYIAECPECKNVNYSRLPISKSDGKPCMICGAVLKARDFYKSIEPRSGFIAEEDVKEVPLTSQERKYKTEAIYIGDPNAFPISTYHYDYNGIGVDVESTANDSLVVKSTDFFYVCPKCGYSIADDEASKLKKFEDYKAGVARIERNDEGHRNPFGRGKCTCNSLSRYCLHHEFKTDVAKISFGCDTSDYATMLSVMYALLNSFANEFNIERRDIKACLTYKRYNGIMSHKIIIYDAVPGGAGHSRRLASENGDVLKRVIDRAAESLRQCDCSPSCYRCLRNYENQKVHEILDREKAMSFLERFV